MNAHTPFDANQDWTNPYCQNSSNDPMVDALLGNAYHVVRTVYCNLGNLKLIYDFLNQYGMVLGVQSEAELKALTTEAKYARIYGFSRVGDRQVTDYLYVEGDRTGILPNDTTATGSWITVATSGSGGDSGGISSGEGAYIPWVYSNGSATGGETSINVPDGTVGVPFIIVNGDMQYVGRGFEFNVDNLSVTLAQPLEEGDEVVFLLTGVPAVPDNPNVNDWIQINWLYNNGVAVGGEQVIAIPYTFQSIPAVYKNGLRLYKGLTTESYTADPDNQRILLTEPLATNDRLIVQIGGEVQVLEASDHTLQEVARSTNVKDSEVILSTDSTQFLNDKKIVYSVSEQKAYGLPVLPTNVFIQSVDNGKLTYSPGNITVDLVPLPDSAEYLEELLSSSTGATHVTNGSETVATQLNKLLRGSTNVFYLDNEGAVGDSSTNGGGADDSAAFESAFAKVKAAGGGIVYGTPGKSYRMTRTALYPSNIIIDMQGARIYWDCPTTAPEASFWLPETFQMANNTDYVENVIIRNVVIASPPNLGNAIGVMKARNILIEDIHTESLWLHTVDGCGAKNMVIRRVRAEFASALSHLQVDCAVGEKSVTGADAIGNYMFTAFDPTGTATWSVCDSVWIEDCYLANNLYSGISVHNYAGARIFIRNNVIINNLLAGINSDSSGGYYRLLWIEGNYISGSRNYELNLAGNHRHLIIRGNTLVSSNRTVDAAAGVSGSGLISMRAATTDTTQRNYALIDGNLFMGRDKAVTIQNYQNLRYTNNIHNAMGDSSYGTVTSVATWAVALSGCEPAVINNNSFYDCALDTCILVNNYLGNPALVSGQVCNNSFRGTGAMIKVVSANRMLVSGNTGTPVAEAPVGIFVSAMNILSAVSNNTISMNGDVPAIQANNCNGIYLSGNNLNSSSISGSGIVGLDCSDIRTANNNIRAVIKAIDAQGTTVMTCHEPFIPVANLIKSGTGSITYNTFTTATK